jgi:hypothetical protein
MPLDQENKKRRSGQPKTGPLGWKYSLSGTGGTGTGLLLAVYSERPEGYLGDTPTG